MPPGKPKDQDYILKNNKQNFICMVYKNLILIIKVCYIHSSFPDHKRRVATFESVQDSVIFAWQFGTFYHFCHRATWYPMQEFLSQEAVTRNEPHSLLDFYSTINPSIEVFLEQSNTPYKFNTGRGRKFPQTGTCKSTLLESKLHAMWPQIWWEHTSVLQTWLTEPIKPVSLVDITHHKNNKNISF